jgi:predicted DNA-binding transcriptional regulator AlpA
VSHPEKKLIGMPAVLGRVPLCKASVYSLIARGEFPAPVKMAGVVRGSSMR